MKKIFQLILLAALFGGNCNPVQAAAYTVTPATEAPDWQMDWSYNQSRPNWQAPNATDFSSFLVMFIKIEDVLQPYASKDDLLAIFVDNEMRGLASPAYVVGSDDTPPTTFVIKVFSNEANGDMIEVSMKYYSAKLNHIFTFEYITFYDENYAIGVNEDFTPPFTLGSPKFPVVNSLDVADIIYSTDIEPYDGDKAAVFVGDECRGVVQLSTLDPQGLSLYYQLSYLLVYGRKTGETYILKYYSTEDECVYTFTIGKLPLGDVNGDGVVDVADISSIVSVMSGNKGDIDIADADVNKDGAVDVADIATVISKMATK